MNEKRRRVLVIAAALLTSALLGVVAHWLLSGGTRLLPVEPELADFAPPDPARQPMQLQPPRLKPAPPVAVQPVEQPAEPVLETTGPVTITGRVIDENGRVIPGARVLVPRTLTHGSLLIDLQSTQTQQSLTDDGGRYELTLPPGVSASVFLSADAKGYTLDTPVRIADVRDPAQRSGVDVHVFQPGSVTGRVVDAEGNPVAGILVQAFQSTAGRSATLNRFHGLTAADGTYTATGLRAGPWAIQIGEFRMPNVGAYATRRGVFLDSQFHVAVGGSELSAPDIVLGPPTQLEFRLLQPDGLPPAANTGVRLTMTVLDEMSFGVALRSGEDGLVTVYGLPASLHEIHAINVDGFQPIENVAIRLIEGQPTNLGTLWLASTIE
jgi:hypothetical protein